FGVIDGTPVFGLPGNPVSSLVSFELFARPALLKMIGHRARFRPEVTATAERAMPRKPDGKLHLDRVQLRAEGDGYVAARTGDQASNVLSATAAANGLALLPDGDGVPAGGAVRGRRLRAPADRWSARAAAGVGPGPAPGSPSRRRSAGQPSRHPGGTGVPAGTRTATADDVLTPPPLVVPDSHTSTTVPAPAVAAPGRDGVPDGLERG